MGATAFLGDFEGCLLLSERCSVGKICARGAHVCSAWGKGGGSARTLATAKGSSGKAAMGSG